MTKTNWPVTQKYQTLVHNRCARCNLYNTWHNTFIILLHYYYNSNTILIQYYYNTLVILLQYVYNTPIWKVPQLPSPMAHWQWGLRDASPSKKCQVDT